MELPASLPQRLSLLAYDTRRRRLRGRTQLGHLLRAAALTDLLLRGLVADDRGKVVTGRPADPLDDPVLGAVLRQVAESRPRSWSHWVRSGQRPLRRAVREQLEEGGWIQVEQRRVLGIFPASRIAVRDTRVLRRLAAIVGRTLGAGLPAARVDPADAALVALAAAGELSTAVSRRQRREHRQRIASLGERAGPAVPALRKVLQQLRASAAS